ncbi:MAG: Crp/Fnr family transcriptional regulator [Actinomycetota bacterium]|nr:Crp/Fnr family transcriptional regulator [Actinomycetota bacterium]
MTSGDLVEGLISLLSPEESQGLKARGRRRRYPRGSTLFNEGESSDKVVLIEQGRVKLSFFTDEGQEIMLALRGAGELIGELSVLDGEPRSATATALEDVDALVLSAEEFKGFLETTPRVAMKLLQITSRRLRDADDKRIEFGAFDTAGRVARRLIELAERFGEASGEGTKIDVALSQQDLAAWTGASREAVSKALQMMRARGWIETHRRGVTLLDTDALRRRAR